MPTYYAAAICPRGHVFSDHVNLDGVKQLRVGCEDCGLMVLTGCEVCGHRIRGDAVPELTGGWGEYKRPEFCDNPDCRGPHPWASRQSRIYRLENLLDGAGLSGDDHKAVERELRSLASDELDEQEETERWARIKKLAPRVWQEGKPVIYSMLNEAMKKGLDGL